MSYQAIVATLENVQPHPNADRLQIATVLNGSHNIVVGLENKTGDVGVYFATDGKLSEEYCIQNELFPIYDQSGAKIGGGMFDPKNRRVRAQNLRSVKSDGYFASLDSVAFTGVNLADLYVGFQFDVLNDVLICEKYYTPQTLRAMKGGTAATRRVVPMLPMHQDTKQFAYEAETIAVGSICTTTLKIHGTSHRLANALVDVEHPQKWHHKILRKTPRITQEWKIVHGTRRVILGEHDERMSFYGTDKFRYDATAFLEPNLKKGEVIYGEIVGYVNDTTLVMGEVSTKDLKKDREFKSFFGGTIPETMKYTYNCLPGQADFYVYRIAMADEEGNLVELSWPQVKKRCRELGAKFCPDFGLLPYTVSKKEGIAELEEIVENFNSGADPIDPSHIREGVVVRVDQPDGSVRFLKSKNYFFKVLESIIKANEEYIDVEEVN